MDERSEEGGGLFLRVPTGKWKKSIDSVEVTLHTIVLVLKCFTKLEYFGLVDPR